MYLEFRDTEGKYIKQWPNWIGVVPQKDDIVLLHYGDYNEREEQYLVKARIIDGTKHDKVVLIINNL